LTKIRQNIFLERAAKRSAGILLDEENKKKGKPNYKGIPDILMAS
jgi:hypothetical protein